MHLCSSLIHIAMALPCLAQLDPCISNSIANAESSSNNHVTSPVIINYSSSSGGGGSRDGSSKLKVALLGCVLWNFVQALVVLDFKKHQADGRWAWHIT
jgi:hypothetical protein